MLKRDPGSPPHMHTLPHTQMVMRVTATHVHPEPPPTYPTRPTMTQTQMVMRVTALRGSVPQQWVSDFQAALEGYGVLALSQRAQLADIFAELAGNK